MLDESDQTGGNKYSQMAEAAIKADPLDGRSLAEFATPETKADVLVKISNIIEVLEVGPYKFLKTLEMALERTLEKVREDDPGERDRLAATLELLSEQLNAQAVDIRFDFTSPPKVAPISYQGASVDGDPYAFLMKHWGGWIARKLITFERLSDLDRPLWLALRNKAQRDPGYPKPKDVFPTNKEYTRSLEGLMG